MLEVVLQARYRGKKSLMIVALILVIFGMEVRAAANIESCKEIVQSLLIGQPSPGYTGGSWYTNKGAAVDTLCLPRDPEWGNYRDGTDGDKAYVLGAEYQTYDSLGNLRKLHNHDVPCAVCFRRNRSVVRMFPARKTCYKGWKLEYRGYLMAGYHDHRAGTMYTCIDEHPDTLHGGHTDKNGKLFYSVEALCGSLKCPPYVQGRELKSNPKEIIDIDIRIGRTKPKLTAAMKASFDPTGPETKNSSVVYTRWGKKTCPSNAELVLSGYTGGSWYDHKGAAVDLLCLPRDPEWGIYTDGDDDSRARVYGAEYETHASPGYIRTFYQHDVPCAVCLLRNKSVVKMFPARKSCYKGWKLEYNGYLMAGYHGQLASTMYTCIDEHPDTLHGGHANKNGYLFYSVEARCGSLKCPPYVEGRELVCAVCSME
uniref:Short-chain collagen C4 n=1 Tax=Magallana gigas TaxID=29159 RepID=K1QZL2_MAGGI